jgi:hypothetical protein
MRTALLTLLPLRLVALTAASALGVACGGNDSLPTGSWSSHHAGGTGGGTVGTPGSSGSSSSSGTNGATGSSSSGSGSSGGSSSGGSSSSGSSSSGGSSSGSSSGTTSSSGGPSGSSSGSTQTSPANLAVTVAQSSIQMQLMAQTVVSVSVAPNGYSGTVQLAANTLPSGVTASFDHSSLTLDGSTAVTAQLTLVSATDAAPGTASVSVDATASGTTKSAPLSVDVQSVITLHIPAGVDDTGATIVNPNTTAFGPYPITIVAPQNISSQSPVTVYFKNDDTVPHEIHADASAQGFGHDPGAFGAGQMDPYVRKVNTAGTYDFYLHDQGSPLTIGRLHIQ